ncbi:MAG: hypothetical protein HQL91_11170 [Magnetococcales bacterium]|nr:hypothetical protein [Magnetococcales bacterium]
MISSEKEINRVCWVATAQGVVEVALDGGGNVGDRVAVRDERAVRVQDAVAPHLHCSTFNAVLGRTISLRMSSSGR